MEFLTKFLSGLFLSLHIIASSPTPTVTVTPTPTLTTTPTPTVEKIITKKRTSYFDRQEAKEIGYSDAEIDEYLKYCAENGCTPQKPSVYEESQQRQSIHCASRTFGSYTYTDCY